MKLKSKEFAIVFAKLILTTFFVITFAAAQDSTTNQNSSRALLNSSLEFLRDKIQNSNFALNENDLKKIERNGNTFLIPRYLRLKGITNIPIIEQQIKVGKVRFSDPQSENKITGFKLLKIQSKSVVETLGLQPSDIIYKINGDLVQTTNDVTTIFNKLKAKDLIELSIIRNKAIVNYIFKFV